MLEDRVAADSIRQTGMGFFGIQGPWYTVGWKMATTIERVGGRRRLIAVLCDPAGLLAAYNTAATEWNRAHGEHLALWSDSLVTRLESR